MRYLAILLIALLACSAPLGGQAEADDPYSIHLVQNNLANDAVSLGVGSVGKVFPRLGDGVSIALIKILSEQDMKDPKTVHTSLQLIRTSFSYTQIISPQLNKEPKVTMFFLKYLQQNISDPKTQQDIEDTMGYVRLQTKE